MSSTPTSHRSVSRLNRAYIQVPSSPLTLSHNLALSTPNTTPAHVPSSKLKENTPVRPSLLAMTHSSSTTSLKRKISDREGPSQVLEGVIISSKKSRLSMHTSTGLKSRPDISAKSNSAENTLNEFVYCHQCNKKRDAAETIRCTVIERRQAPKSKTIKERMCTYKYCKYCLKNRYDEDIDKLKSQLSERNDTTCGFQCPRCRDICNCPRCRKSKGLEAIGFISKEKSKPSNSATHSAKVKAKAQSLREAKEREITTAKLRALPAINWSSLSIDLDQGEVEERMFIREFILRFGDFLDPIVAKSHIEELELIGGRLRKNDDHIGTSWVSDMCVRALIISILGVLARDCDVDVSKTIKSAVKEVKSAGTNLSKIWTVLAQLRHDIVHISTSEPDGSDSPDREAYLTFPDPSPAPASAANPRRSLRQEGPTIVCSTQMIPLLVSLIHSALETTIIREEIDRGSKDAKDFGRDARDATRIENERWEKERNTMELSTKDKALKIENRNKRASHKLQLTNIENSLKIIGPSFSPRFSPLGIDNEGRIYYAISPGMAERESALEYLELAASEKLLKPKKKCPLPSVDDRVEMREWSWFVAVWGNSPASSGISSAQELAINDSDSEDEDDTEKWWGFWDPDEISRLSQWICIKAGVDDDDQSTNGEPATISHKEKVALPPRLAQYKRLAVELKDYANLLRWRTRDDKTALINGLPVNQQRH